MMMAGCCCGGECSCPSGTTLPSSVSLTITVTGCQGTTAVVTCVLLLNANAPCVVGVCLCQKYSFTANLNTAGGCGGNYACNMPYDYFDTCQNGTPDPGQALIGIAKAAIGTNGIGFDSEEYPACDVWFLRLTLELKGGLTDPTAQSANGVCGDCRWHYPAFPCGAPASQKFDMGFWKATGTDPRGTYVSAVGSPIPDSCWVDVPPPCEPCEGSWGMTINDITIA